MPIETIEHKGNVYPAFQSSGNAARFIRGFAMEVCKGEGCDIGANRPEWAFPGSIPIDLSFTDGYHAMNLPGGLMKEYDYLTSSHMLEHLEHPYTALNYWHTRLKQGGIVFLYLPSHENSYWRPWNKKNSEHVHQFTPQIIRSYFEDQPERWKNIFVSGVDLNSSFVAIAEKV